MAEPQSLNTNDLVEWVAELQAGRPDAAEPTFRRIMTRVERLAGAMFKKFPRVGRFVDVDDVVQNSLVRLLAAFRKIRPTSTSHFYALTNQLIRRELLDLAKHYYGPEGHGANLSPAAIADGEHVSPETVPGQAELDRLASFHEAVTELPAEEREVIGLTYYHDWSQQEIAELFQVSTRTVQRWLKSGTLALQAKVGPS